MTTRKVVLTHLLTDVLERTNREKPFVLVVDHLGCRGITDFICLDPDDLKGTFGFISSGTTASTQTVLAKAEFNELIDLQDFIRNNSCDPLFDWMRVTSDDFELFRDGKPTMATPTARVTAPMATVANPTVSLSVSKSMMKRQYSDYKEIQKRHFFLQWKSELEATAMTHNCTNPLDHTYVPATPEDVDVFAMDQAFMIVVFVQNIKCPSGQTIVNRHLKNMDAQAAYIELVEDATAEVVQLITGRS